MRKFLMAVLILSLYSSLNSMEIEQQKEPKSIYDLPLFCAKIAYQLSRQPAIGTAKKFVPNSYADAKMVYHFFARTSEFRGNFTILFGHYPFNDEINYYITTYDIDSQPTLEDFKNRFEKVTPHLSKKWRIKKTTENTYLLEKPAMHWSEYRIICSFADKFKITLDQNYNERYSLVDLKESNSISTNVSYETLRKFEGIFDPECTKIAKERVKLFMWLTKPCSSTKRVLTVPGLARVIVMHAYPYGSIE